MVKAPAGRVLRIADLVDDDSADDGFFGGVEREPLIGLTGVPSRNRSV
jgi:hypothetical protein